MISAAIKPLYTGKLLEVARLTLLVLVVKILSGFAHLVSLSKETGAKLRFI